MPVAILMLVMLMIVPVPTLLLDIGFVANIMLSLVILMIALNSARALDFSAFPTVLLFATLFRLSLNVASTRIVLVNGQKGGAAAGHVIEAFGQFMIGGNYVVGIFVFAVLMIINIVVITKGAGRVSEVSARFTLDALPGKQMAVDADLNAGLITPDEAKLRRQEVSTEADFFGSMDGASKFVKGDAVAGILILAVNILGGLVLGVVSHNMAIGDAAKTYLTLAIGDALVAQVPALLLSIAAAAIVTRVSSPLDLAGQITSQFGVAKAWYPVAGIMAFLGILPGMPHILLLLGAGGAGYLAWRLSRPQPVPLIEATEIRAPELDWGDVCESSPIVLELGYGLIELIDERKGAPLMGRITSLRRQLSRELGFVLPMVKVKDDLALPGNAYRLTIAGVVGGEDEVFPGELLALDAGDCLPGVTGREVRDPTFGLPALWIETSKRTDAIIAGYTVVDAPTVIATHLNEILNRASAALFGLEEAQALVEGLKTHAPQLVAALTPQPYSLSAVTALCRGLLAERVPLKDFRRIADAMVEVSPQALPTAQLLEAVRQRIGGLIVQPLAPIKLPIPVVTFSGELEELLAKSCRAAPDALWPFEPQLAEGVMTALEIKVQPELAAARNFAVVTSPVCRAPLARLLATRLPDVPVLSFSELPEHRRVDVLHVVGGGGAPALAAPEPVSGDLS